MPPRWPGSRCVPKGWVTHWEVVVVGSGGLGAGHETSGDVAAIRFLVVRCLVPPWGGVAVCLGLWRNAVCVGVSGQRLATEEGLELIHPP